MLGIAFWLRSMLPRHLGLRIRLSAALSLRRDRKHVRMSQARWKRDNARRFPLRLCQSDSLTCRQWRTPRAALHIKHSQSCCRTSASGISSLYFLVYSCFFSRALSVSGNLTPYRPYPYLRPRPAHHSALSAPAPRGTESHRRCSSAQRPRCPHPGHPVSKS